MNPNDYTRARDLFEAALEATREITRQNAIISAMEAREGARGANLAGVGHAPGIGDPYAATDVRIDFEAAARATIAEDEALIDYACAVLYGRDQMGRDGGLWTLAPHACADVICLRYCMGMEWDDVAATVHYSVRWAQRRAATGFEVIDAYGFAATIEGRGRAT